MRARAGGGLAGIAERHERFVSSVMWTAFETSVSFGDSAVLFAAGAMLVRRLAVQPE